MASDIDSCDDHDIDDNDGDDCTCLSKYDSIHLIGGCYDIKGQELQTCLGNYISNRDHKRIWCDFDGKNK